MLRGIGTSKGIGIGKALVLKNTGCEVKKYKSCLAIMIMIDYRDYI